MSTPNIYFWLDFVPHSLIVFRHLRDEVEWDSSMHARKTASFGVPYNYSQMSYPERPMPALIAQMLEPIAAEVGWMANNCLLNFYADGDSTMGFHFDSLEIIEADTGVAIVSLGEQRVLTFAH